MRLDDRGRPGHEKDLANVWVIARFADPSLDGINTREVLAARAALGCGDLAELLRAIQEPLTPARFVRNVALAWRLQSMRIPPDPIQAERELCGRAAG